MKAGFIGLGYLGKAMAKRLIGEGVELIVWNRTKEKAADLGVPVAGSPKELISKADIVFLSLFDSNAVADILYGESGLFNGNCKGKIIVDTSTNHFNRVLKFHEDAAKHGVYYLESPVLGSVGPASQGALTVLVSGDQRAFEKVKPYLEKLGKNIFYLEKISLATKMKLINNLVLGTLMATCAEAITFGEKAGLDRETILNILLTGAGNSAVLAGKKEKLIKGDFSRQFSSSLIYKDLHYLEDLAFDMKKPLYIGGVVKELYGMTYPERIEDEDFSAVYKILKKY
jgi:3-hydroxyisobutyrate dehydrogenase